MVYLHLTEEERKGITLSLVDPLIPTLAVGKYKDLVNAAKKANTASDLVGSSSPANIALDFLLRMNPKEYLVKGNIMALVRH